MSFYAPGRRTTTPSTECYACGARKAAHGPNLECPGELEDMDQQAAIDAEVDREIERRRGL